MEAASKAIWNSQVSESDDSELAGLPIQLRIDILNAELYSFVTEGVRHFEDPFLEIEGGKKMP